MRAAVLLFLPLIAATPARAAELLAPAGSIPLPQVSGRIDHMAVDLARKRLFVAEYGNDTLDVVDLVAGRRTGQVAGLAHPQGAGYSAKADMLAVGNGGDGTVRLYRGRDLAPLGTVALGQDADNLLVDPRNGDVIAAHGGGGLAIIDPASRRKIADIRLPAHPEAFRLDPASGRIFANVPGVGGIAVVDLAAGQAIARWTAPGLGGNFPMALDGEGRRLAVVFRHPPRLVLLDAGSGVEIARLPVCADADDVFFDARRRRIYVSCGAGVVDIFEGGAGGWRAAGRLATARGARTALFVPELDRLYVAAPAAFPGAGARILIFRPQS